MKNTRLFERTYPPGTAAKGNVWNASVFYEIDAFLGAARRVYESIRKVLWKHYQRRGTTGRWSSIRKVLNSTSNVLSSTMLLLGLSFEDLIKGVYVARNPALVDRARLDRSLWRSAGGHGIRDFAKSLIELEPVEEDLLDWLQEYVVWAGRFPIPTKSGRYHQNRSPVNKQQFSVADFSVADQLFEKLRKQLFQFRENRTATA